MESVWVSIGYQQKPHFGVAAGYQELELFGVLDEPECLPPTARVEWNINPDLNQQERETLRTSLEEYL